MICKSVATVHDLIDQHQSGALVGENECGAERCSSCVCSPEGLHAPPVPPKHTSRLALNPAPPLSGVLPRSPMID